MVWAETVLGQLREVYDGAPWYGMSVKSILNDIIPEGAELSPDDDAHSVYQLGRHMLNWRKYVVEKLKGNNAFQIVVDSDDDWNNKTTGAKQWMALLTEFEENQKELVQLIKSVPHEKLDKTVSGKPYSYRHLIEGIIHHDIYHAGQIVTTGKITKAYKPSA